MTSFVFYVTDSEIRVPVHLGFCTYRKCTIVYNNIYWFSFFVEVFYCWFSCNMLIIDRKGSNGFIGTVVGKGQFLKTFREFLGNEVSLHWTKFCLESNVHMCCSIPVEWKEGQAVFSSCTVFARNYSELRALPTKQHDLAAANITSCKHGWTFDYSQYATTVVTEVISDSMSNLLRT